MKRFWITIGVLLGCALLFCVGLGVILALAPGSRIFGITYVSASVGKANLNEEWTDSVSGDIFIQTREIPVELSFEPYGKFKVEFVQEYSGYTLSSNRVPDATITRDADGIHVNTKEVERFIFGINHKGVLKLSIPESFGTNGRHSIYVSGKKSRVTVSAVDDVTLKFVELSLRGKGDVKINSKVECRTLTVSSPKSLTLDGKINAENVNFESNSGSLKVGYELQGNLTVKTNSGRVQFVSCNNAKITTSGGRVEGIDGAGCVILGKADITTKGGAVKIKSMMALDENKVTTNAGSITIENMLTGTITSPRGKININHLYSAKIIGGTNTVTVGDVSGSVEISTKRGSVNAGSETQTVANIKVSTVTGKVKLNGTTGTVDVTTKNSDVVLNNASAAIVKIAGGRAVTASNLFGKFNISAGRDINISGSKISADSSVTGGSRTRKIEINLDDATESNMNYKLTSTDKKRGLCTLYVAGQVKKQGLSIETEPAISLAPTITVSATKCKINLYVY